MRALRGRRGGLLLALVAALGVAAVVVALMAQQPAPPAVPGGAIGDVPPAAPADDRSSSRREASGGAEPRGSSSADSPLPRSAPVHLSIPRIGVDTEVFGLGLAPDGTLAVPQPGPRLDLAAWFRRSPAPGQPGPSIIEGHVATEQGPSVFFDLADLRPGDRIDVRRADGITVTFEVDALRTFDKDRFPTEVVYGGDLSTPQLRLITCSDFNPSTGHHDGNVVVFSHRVEVSRGDR
ncbi:class F sortase [Nocardioides sp. SYSU DS0663]|uniref:class F sortase n=1 Tax=Nocardioides sp. SYSU DS0663 TaxID=3416445 RepID=UPI003F4C5A03